MISNSGQQLNKIFKYTVYGAAAATGFAGFRGGVSNYSNFTVDRKSGNIFTKKAFSWYSPVIIYK